MSGKDIFGNVSGTNVHGTANDKTIHGGREKDVHGRPMHDIFGNATGEEESDNEGGNIWGS